MTRVIIAGGGVAGLEALLALRDFAEDRVDIELVAPEDEFAYRPLQVGAPFALGKTRTYSLPTIAQSRGARFRHDALARVDPERHTMLTSSGDEAVYDALLVAVGARAAPSVPGAIHFAGREDAPELRRLLAEIADGRARRVAFVVPSGVSWALPAYELALLTARDAEQRGARPELSVVTPEEAPLGLFGHAASDAVGELLERRGIAFVGATYASELTGDGLHAGPDAPALAFDRVVALPRLAGASFPGLPPGPGGFLQVDRHGRVAGQDAVWAAGDAVDFPVKQGGIAAQQADAAAQDIAAVSGAPIDPQPFRPVLRGVLLTGERPRYMRHTVAGGAGEDSTVADHALWWPPSKIAARYLGPYLGAAHEEIVVGRNVGLPIEVELEHAFGAAHPPRPEIPSYRRPDLPKGF